MEAAIKFAQVIFLHYNYVTNIEEYNIRILTPLVQPCIKMLLF